MLPNRSKLCCFYFLDEKYYHISTFKIALHCIAFSSWSADDDMQFHLKYIKCTYFTAKI